MVLWNRPFIKRKIFPIFASGHRSLFVFLCVLVFAFQPGMLSAGDAAPSSATDETMLMFVGEDLEVLSIASRRQESAWQAPAVAQVVTRQ